MNLQLRLLPGHLQQILETAGVACKLSGLPLISPNSYQHSQVASIPNEQSEIELKELPFLGCILPPFIYQSRFIPVVRLPRELLESEAEGPATELLLLAKFKYANFDAVTKGLDFIWKVEYLKLNQVVEAGPQPGYFSNVQTPFNVNTSTTKLLIIADLPTHNKMDRMRLSIDLKTDRCLDYLKTNLKQCIVALGRKIVGEVFADPSRQDPSQILSCLHHLTLYVLLPMKKCGKRTVWKALDSMDLLEFAGFVWRYLENHRPLRVSFKMEEIRKIEKIILGQSNNIKDDLFVEEEKVIGNAKARKKEHELRLLEERLEKKGEELIEMEERMKMNHKRLTMKFQNISRYLQEDGFEMLQDNPSEIKSGSSSPAQVLVPCEDGASECAVTLSEATTQERDDRFKPLVKDGNKKEGTLPSKNKEKVLGSWFDGSDLGVKFENKWESVTRKGKRKSKKGKGKVL